MGKRKKKDNLYTADSTMWCEICKETVKVGVGGMGNFASHEASKRHTQSVSLAKGNQTIGSFFRKAPTASQVAIGAGTSLSSMFVHAAKLTQPHIAPLVPSPPSRQPDSPIIIDAAPPPPPPRSTLFTKLKTAISTLPTIVPIGSKDDDIARFSGNPVYEMDDEEDAWEMVDKALNRLIGFGKTGKEIESIIRRGQYGMDGMFSWLEKCVYELKIGEALLENKIERLIGAMIELGASLGVIEVDQDSEIEEIEEIVHLIAKDTVTLPDKLLPTGNHTAGLNTPPASKPCPGYILKLTDGQSAFALYPFILHSKHDLPWSFSKDKEHLVLHSDKCTKISNTPCISCSRLHDDTIIMGIRHCALSGADPKTPWHWLSAAHMYTALEKKTEQINALKLNSLNAIRAIGVRNLHIDVWKRVHMAIVNSDIPRLRSLLVVAHRAGAGVVAILEKVREAAARKYSPKSYDEAQYQLGYLMYKIGGRAAADLAYATLGTPSIDTSKRHISTHPLIPSASFPTKSELTFNLDACYPTSNTAEAGTKGMTIQIDEIKIQERLRWDPKSNKILGVCREHGDKCSLEFRSMNQANELLDCLQNELVHLATEATVIGTSILSRDPNSYTTRAFAISGSCKRETVENQERLLRDAIDAVCEKAVHQHAKVYCIASDGDSRRRRALISIAIISDVSQLSPLHGLLGDLPLFNLKCGKDNITPDFDWKHVLKRFRNTTLRQKGISINDVAISTDTIKTHLISHGMSTQSADILLAPNDRQDVVLMIKLLHALALLKSPTARDSPLVHATRRSLVLLGRIYWNLLRAYLDTSLSLNDQLVHLSTAAHLILAIYNQDKGDFIPVQTYFDVMSMIKNIYFCVAKTQLDDPDGEFWIVLLGTDGLEKVFGKVRTIVGNDTNADQLQLTNRIDGAVQCVNILEQHPEWGGQSRRLSVKPLFDTGSPVNADTEITSTYDHISPRSCTGDLRVSEVNLRGCWMSGRRAAENTLEDGHLQPPFADMEKTGGFDMLCPFGKSKMVLVDGSLAPGEREETDEERDDSVLAESQAVSQAVTSPEEDDLTPQDASTESETEDHQEPDLDDIVGVAHAEIERSHTTVRVITSHTLIHQ